MICPNCNSQMPDNIKYCTICGTRLDVAPKQRAGRSHLPVVAGTLAGILIGGAVTAALLTGGFGLLSAPDEGDAPAVVQAVQDEAGTASPEPSVISVDLGNTEDYEALNVFLSCYTELPRGLNARDTFRREDDLTSEECTDIVTFLVYHMMCNGNSYVEEASGPLASQGYRWRVATRYLNSLAFRYTGLTFTDAQLVYDNNPGASGDAADKGTVQDGWFYFTYDTTVNWPSQGVAAATSAEDLGNNRYRVSFDVYEPGSGFYPSTISRETYGLPVSQMVSALNADATPAYSATAVVEARFDEGGELSFSLCEMN